MKRILPGIVFLVLILIAESAISEDYFSKIFGDMDINHNSYIEYEEYQYYMTYPERKEFEAMDVSEDGKVQLFEWVNFRQKLDPKVQKFEYRYEDRSGNRFYHKDKSWYRISKGDVYKFGGTEWKKLEKAHAVYVYPLYRWCDPFWDSYYYPHDRFHFGYHHRYGCRHGFRYWD